VPLDAIRERIARIPEWSGLVARLSAGGSVRLAGLAGSSRALVPAALAASAGRGALFVVADAETAEALETDLALAAPAGRVASFLSLEALPYDDKSPHPMTVAARMATLSRLSRGERLFVVAPVRALLARVLPPDALADALLSLRVGDPYEPRDLAEALVALGFERRPVVDEPGTMSVRGGIVDVFAHAEEAPVRIELGGDGIESMRSFDPRTQRSTGRVDAVVVLPQTEIPLVPRVARRAAACALPGLAGENIRRAAPWDGMEAFLPHYFERVATLADYLPDDVAVVLPEAREIEAQEAHLWEEAERFRAARAEAAPELAGALPEPAALFATLAEVRAALSGRAVVSLEPRGSALAGAAAPGRFAASAAFGAPAPASALAVFHAEPQPSYAGSLTHLRSDIARLGATSDVFLLCDNEGQAERLRELLDADLPNRSDLDAAPDARTAPDEAPARWREPETLLRPGEAVSDRPRRARSDSPPSAPRVPTPVTVAVGALHEGFVLPEARVVVFTDHELFNRYRRTRRAPRYRGAGPIEDFHALREGDFVVHVNHGIGRFQRLERIDVDGQRHDCLVVAYQGADRLFVPTDQLDLLEKYVGKEGEVARLDRLGGKEWARLKARTKKAIKDMADELLQIYAARRAQSGHAFGVDTHWQRELESSFIYEETADQTRAVAEVKRDMESARPMDRLVCGDVGYGKTEVAVRAAFKAVMDGKQVAVLVPTTLLAEQHLTTFRERLADFPVRVEMLSRFRTVAQQAEILRDLAVGQLEIVIGTHRLLQKDVVFKDLGLVVVDEEQRFGVAHKERLKKLRRLVDVLTLTATPIPRTMHMALLGVRDMSAIETPPPGRLPIETEIVEWKDEQIASAILREIDRGGQAFFVHNRIETIDSVTAHLSRLLPEVRFAVAHGQMAERELERVMVEFLDRKHDVLVSTMIIESGLDIPSVNTILVNRADTLGLAQLYQLRGRVGRTSTRAYAYLIAPPPRSVPEVAWKRLCALRDFTDLGSGFKIAMKDLEIRGAGNLLGAEQHGYMVAVGFDLYCRLLEEAVRELKGEPETTPVSARIDADVDAFLPDELIDDGEQKLHFYKRLARTTTIDEVRSLEEELRDRYGALPEPAANLFALRALRLAAERAGVEQVRLSRDRLRVQLSSSRPVGRGVVKALVAASETPLEFLAGDGRSFRTALRGAGPSDWIQKTGMLLKAIEASDKIAG
jgi:transcription-repair coupling factor (superfamily II helicase)